MNVTLAKENEDGSAVFTFDMTPEETKMMVLYGIKCALEAAVRDAEAWNGDADLQELQQDNAGLSD